MNRDWKKIAEGFQLNIPDDAVEQAAAVLDRLEVVFRPLAQDIPVSASPAVVYRCPEEVER
jgi:hypothetical protein